MTPYLLGLSVGGSTSGIPTPIGCVMLGGQHCFMNCLVRLCDHVGKLLRFLRITVAHESYVTE